MTLGRNTKAVVVILVAFAIGLMGFYAFSATYGDGLERTMDDNGVSEGHPVWEAPLDYGDGYSSGLVMGIVGFLLVTLVMLAYLLAVRGRKNRKAN